MSVTFNWNTVLSSFDERGTLLKQLKSMEDAFEAAGMTGCEVVDPTDTSLKLKFTFADGSSLTTAAIDIKGAKGDKGDTATVAVGTVTTGDAGSDATVTNVGTSSNAVFDFSIPRGNTGAAGGITNIDGYTGAVTAGNGIALDTTTGELSSYDFNLSDTGTINIGQLAAASLINVSSASGSLQYALNADKTIGKIYYYADLTLNLSESGHARIKTGLQVSAPDTGYYIQTGGPIFDVSAGYTANASGLIASQFYVDTAGSIYIDYYSPSATTKKIRMTFPACIYFFKDFGDTPDVNTLAMRMNALNIDPVEEPQER